MMMVMDTARVNIRFSQIARVKSLMNVNRLAIEVIRGIPECQSSKLRECTILS